MHEILHILGGCGESHPSLLLLLTAINEINLTNLSIILKLNAWKLKNICAKIVARK